MLLQSLNPKMTSGSDDVTSEKVSCDVSSDTQSDDSDTHLHQSSPNEEERQAWGGRFEFFLTMVGYAVGLGNVWRFPYLCYKNGGGAFLIPFVICLVLLGIPMFMMELVLGQFSSLGTTSVWKLSPLFKGIGIATVIVTSYIVLYYNVIVSWCLYYLFASMASPLPWATCDNCWNTPGCVTSDGAMAGNMTEIVNHTINGYPVTSSAEEFFYRRVLQLTDGLEERGHVVWQLALLLLLAWIIVFLVLIRGISSLGKVAYFVSLFPYFMLTVMLVFSAMLPGAIDGILFYVTPQWEKLGDPQVWSDAASQVFFSCGCCTGGILGMASYNRFKYNIQRDAVLVPGVVLFTCTYAGFVVFSVLGYVAHTKGVSVEQVAQEGPGLVFVAYPEGLATMPGSTVWAILFFCMMTTLGFSSQFSWVEGICTTTLDEFPSLRYGNNPIFLRGGCCLVGFLLGLPMVTQSGFYLFQIMDKYNANYPLLIVGISELLAVSWAYGLGRLSDDIAMMLGRRPSRFWLASWAFVAPLFLMVVLGFQAANETPLRYGSYEYPGWAMSVAWLIVAFPILAMVGWCIIQLCMTGGWQILKEATKPEEDWGPRLLSNRTGRYWQPGHGRGPMPAGSDPELGVGEGVDTTQPLNVTEPDPLSEHPDQYIQSKLSMREIHSNMSFDFRE